MVQEPIKGFTLEGPLASGLRALKVFASPAEFKQAVVDEGGNDIHRANLRGDSHEVHRWNRRTRPFW